MSSSPDSGKQPGPHEEQRNDNSSNKTIKDPERSDPPLTEIKGVTEPEEYVEPKVEEEPEKNNSLPDV
jgi:hypothetical protein